MTTRTRVFRLVMRNLVGPLRPAVPPKLLMKKVLAISVSISVVIAAGVSSALAADPENCLSCHRYHGLARVDEESATVRLYDTDPNYYDRALGPHARLRCTDCHKLSEVEVIPHNIVSPVDCTRTCHLVSPGKLEVEFSHDHIAGMLESSVHTSEVLEKCNELLGYPLGVSQSRCLLCHDEPTFRRAGHTWLEQKAPIARCEVCHEGPLQMDAPYAYWHVHARSRPARSNKALAQACAMCHSDPKVREFYELPDATATYLASFHGKAMLLGSEETAGCLDCHVNPLQNVHLMQSSEEPGAPTNAANLSDTCRNSACHTTAGYRVSTAAVHLDLATSRGIEYFVAFLFVLLIIVTFGPSLLLQTLEMLQIVVGRHDPGHARRTELAKRLLANPHSRRALVRFTPQQRVQHWFLFVCFTTLVITGLPIKFADSGWARWVIEQFGGLAVTRFIHRWIGLLMLIGCAFHVLYVLAFILRKKRQTGKGWIRIFFDLPMVMNWDDCKQMGHLIAYLLFLRRTRPEAGRFSLEEKFEYFGVLWGCCLLGFTGIIMWSNAWISQYMTGRVVTMCSLIHTFEAFLALLHVGIIHLVGVIFAPGVFPLSPAMFTGNTPAEKLAEAHAAMLTEVVEPIKAEPAGEPTHE